MSHAGTADNLLIKPTAGARPASPCTPGRFIPKARGRGLTPEESRAARRHLAWRRPLTDRPNESHRRLRASRRSARTSAGQRRSACRSRFPARSVRPLGISPCRLTSRSPTRPRPPLRQRRKLLRLGRSVQPPRSHGVARRRARRSSASPALVSPRDDIRNRVSRRRPSLRQLPDAAAQRE
jgi:hypothetical protein